VFLDQLSSGILIESMDLRMNEFAMSHVRFSRRSDGGSERSQLTTGRVDNTARVCALAAMMIPSFGSPDTCHL
jgi:hypothetical protein